MVHSDPEFAKAWLIPALPLLGFLFNGLAGGLVTKRVAGAVATAAVFGSFALGLMLFGQLSGDPTAHINTLAPWFVVPGFNGAAPLVVNYEILIDHLSLLMILIITGVGGLIHLYSTGYMAADKGYTRFFSYLNLFIFFMLLLVMGNNMVLMFVGWEGVGLCSYLLIGFWYEKESAAAAALKAMVVNRIGDVGVLIGMFLAFWYFKTLDFHNVSGTGLLDLAANSHVAAAITATPAIGAAVTLMTLAIFWGCTGKSAQIPLYTWLPDAMEGPTPVSALIHAATMVTAGVYLVSRMHSLFELSTLTMTVICVIGMATALLAASIGLVQNDIKRVLAYSTCSQLGYMFAACGAGAFTAGMFHVTTHAFFKACLFLGSGAVIHAMEHAMHERHETAHRDESDAPAAAGGPDPDDPQDMRNMGGLKGKLPLTHATMLLSTAAIAGIPLFSGFFSKDEILYQVARHHWSLWFVGVVTAAMTAFYMMRLMYKTFYGSPKSEDAQHTHEATPSMTLPLVILGFLATFAGVLALPSIAGFPKLPNFFEKFLEPAAAPTNPGTLLAPHEPSQIVLLAISAFVALGGVAYAYYAYKAKDGRDLLIAPEEKQHATVYEWALHKWYVDELYYNITTVPGRWIADHLYRVFDLRIVDGAVNGVGWLASQAGALFRTGQTGYVRNYAFTMLIGALIVVIAVLAGFRSIF
ncbi:MAG: NADH-quinone oxidoreductase subunit L [Capsulimonadaceae bacterium]|nr:NADH-quinone oxidoreductase subunit L [Capsulimonadaceae bacterium]